MDIDENSDFDDGVERVTPRYATPDYRDELFQTLHQSPEGAKNWDKSMTTLAADQLYLDANPSSAVTALAASDVRKQIPLYLNNKNRRRDEYQRVMEIPGQPKKLSFEALRKEYECLENIRTAGSSKKRAGKKKRRKKKKAKRKRPPKQARKEGKEKAEDVQLQEKACCKGARVLRQRRAIRSERGRVPTQRVEYRLDETRGPASLASVFEQAVRHDAGSPV